MKLWEYQEKSVETLAIKLAQGVRRIVMQLATGGGKTIMFSAISSRYINNAINADKSVLIVVHRKELLNQTRLTLFKAFNISAQIIVAGQKYIAPAKVYVGMIETVVRRNHFLHNNNVGLLIIDECHIHSFNKIQEHFPTQFIIGFTATPLSASKKFPLKNYYDDIVCGVDIQELIEINKNHSDKGLCQNITFAPRDTVDRASLTVKGSDFDAAKMGDSFSKPQYINNTVSAYKKYAYGSKAIVFNVNIDHSIQVHNTFKIAGYNSRYLDSTMPATERTSILKWFHSTPDAILNNVGILTAGFDEPSIEVVIMNKATLSMPLWLQCTGRGSRPTGAKSSFTIIDMGGNALSHGDWCDKRDWADIFFNPKKPKKGEGVGPVKVCPNCEAIVATAVRICNFCGFSFPVPLPSIEEELSDFIVVTKGIDVAAMIESNKEKKEYYPFYKIGNDVATELKRTSKKITYDIAFFALEKYNVLAKEWCNTKGKKFNQWHQVRAKEHFFSELQKLYKGWVNPIELPLIADIAAPIPVATKVTAPPTNIIVPKTWELSNFFNFKETA